MQKYDDMPVTYWWMNHDLVDMVAMRNNLQENLNGARKSVFIDNKFIGWIFRKRVKDLEGMITYWNDEIETKIHDIEVNNMCRVVRNDGSGKII